MDAKESVSKNVVLQQIADANNNKYGNLSSHK